MTFLALLSSLIFVSCERPNISVSQSAVYFSEYDIVGTSKYISVDANVDWDVSISTSYNLGDYITTNRYTDGFDIVYSTKNDKQRTIEGVVYVYSSEDPSFPARIVEVYISPQYSGDSNNNNNSSNNNNNNSNNNTPSTPEPEPEDEPIIKKPTAPKGVSVSNYGSISYPDVRISWYSVSGATKYYVYRSTSAYGSYSYYAQTSNTYYSDSSCRLGNTYYYKVTAHNSAGESDYSDYAMIEMKDTRKPGLAQYGSCYVSGSRMTLNWSVPTHATYGEPTKAVVKVYEPYIGDWMVLDNLSGTTTSYSFYYGMYVDEDGFVKVGVILENENGSGGGTPKVYDTNSKRFIN